MKRKDENQLEIFDFFVGGLCEVRKEEKKEGKEGKGKDVGEGNGFKEGFRKIGRGGV